MHSDITLLKFIRSRSLQKVRLHLGCGGVRCSDFINVDLHPAKQDETDASRSGCVADVFADIRDLGLPDDCVDEMFSSHVIDHFTRWECVDMLKDWHRMLKSGGIMVIEAADFFRCVLWLFHPNRKRRRLARSQFYGNHLDRVEYETHRYVWSAGEMRHMLLNEVGFASVNITHNTLTHHPGRDMRITAVK